MEDSNKNIFIEKQSVLDTLDVIGGKWKFHIIYALCQKKMRFNELKEELSGISPRALSNALKDLEFNGIIHKETHYTIPISVEYSLTQYGEDMKSLFIILQNWGKAHRKRLLHSDKG